MKVFVYFNLHRKCFSVKALEGASKGRVVAHVSDAIVYEPTFKVSEAGRQRVLRERSKNVHAGVVGQWYAGEFNAKRTAELMECTGRAVTYNPYRFTSFVYKATETPINDSPRVAALHSDGVRASMFATH
jgi:hypothetical protein|tara:strand:+ start:1905 stop:2294 length:390 start_codon:yes stop_codon:yes gene_type:complete